MLMKRVWMITSSTLVQVANVLQPLMIIFKKIQKIQHQHFRLMILAHTMIIYKKLIKTKT